MDKNIYLVIILTLTAGWAHFFSVLKDHFHDDSFYEKKITHLEHRLKKEKFYSFLSQYQFDLFREEVASLLPGAIRKKGKGEASYPLRQMASVVTHKDPQVLSHQMVKKIFERGKTYFRNNQFDRSNQIFSQFVEKYSYSTYVPEAYFLLAEGQFQMRFFDQCTKTVQIMIGLFPENELTGYALLRLGKIYEFQDRVDEALEIYQTVLKSFPYRGVASQAQISVRSVDL